MKFVYFVIYFFVGYVIFLGKYVPGRSDGVLQEVVMPLISLIAFAAFIFLFCFYMYFWRKIRGSNILFWLVRFFLLPFYLIYFVFPMSQSQFGFGEILVLLFIALNCDWFGYLEKCAMNISFFIAKRYPESVN